MTKKLFGFSVIIILACIAVINIIQDAQAKKTEKLAQEEFLAKSFEGEIDIEAISGLSAGEVPPDFELNNLDGETIKLSDFRGQKVILNFWATWCPPCKAEMPHMENYYKKKAASENVEIIAVNLTMAEKGSNRIEKVKKFVNDYGLSFPIPLDEKGDIGDTYQAFTIPTTYMIDQNGLIHKKIIGPMDQEMISKLVKEME